MRWALLPYRRYFEFRGRSRRTEFWPFAIGWAVVSIALSLLGPVLGFEGRRLVGWVFLLAALGSFVPALAVAVRRLHDLNRGGWWAVLPFIPFFVVLVLAPFEDQATESVYEWVGLSVLICPAILLVMLAWKGTTGPNRFGEDPRNPNVDLEAVFG